MWPKLAATDKTKTLILFSLPRWRCQVEKRRMSFTAFKLLPRSFDHVQVMGDKLEVIYIMVVKNVSASVLKTSSGECAKLRKMKRLSEHIVKSHKQHFDKGHSAKKSAMMVCNFLDGQTFLSK